MFTSSATGWNSLGFSFGFSDNEQTKPNLFCKQTSTQNYKTFFSEQLASLIPVNIPAESNILEALPVSGTM